MNWGLYDTQDNCWIGNNEGPLLYDDEEFAKVAARIAGSRMRWHPTRVKAVLYDGTGNKHKDEMKPEISGEEALRRLEEGLDL